MTDPQQRPFAVFDIDGTLIRWQLYHAIADRLAKNGDINADDFKNVRASRMGWKNRSNELSFRLYEDHLVRLINGVISGISVSSFENACQQVIEEYRDQVYTYTRDLIKTLKQKDYLLFVISASQVEIVKLLAEYYGFDDYAGTIYEQNNGRFTGKSTPLLTDRKPVVLREIIKKHAASNKGSIAVGDSESDIPMLASVEQPIAFNPTKKLFQHAKKHGWKVVLERKNMVYELEPQNGSYRLQ